MNGDEFVEQIQDVQKRVAELQQDAKDLPTLQKSRLTESLERLTAALRDLQVAEEAIRLLLSAVQQSRDSIVITTALLDPPGPEIVYVNPAFSLMTGYSTEEVLGKTPRILQGQHTDRQKLNDLRRHLETGEPYHGEAINYHKDGTEFFVEWNITPIRDAQEQITHYVAIQRDISDRKRFEQEREQLLQQEHQARMQAEAANRSKDEFLATLSHELKTPLTPILGWSKVLRTRQLPENKFNEVLETIEEHAKQQAQLVDDLLDLSRIVQGKLLLDLSAVNLAEPIAAALETVRLAAEAKEIQIETQLDPQVGQVMGDAGRLQQVFWNLLSNAIKFTPHSGKINVKLKRVERKEESHPPTYSPTPTHSYAQITIQDNGQGISPEFLPYVFDRFRQEDSSISRKFGGLGLGLSISRQLVEAHGGTIAADSPGIGQGATFTVQLPLIPAPIDSANQSVPKAAYNLSNIRILAVDDEVSTLQFVRFVLEQEGAIVKAVTSARDALQALSKNEFDLLISDIGMQEMDGYRLMQEICSNPELRNRVLPGIALTAYTSISKRKEALAAGYHYHLAKPFDPEDLIQAIGQVLSKQESAQEQA